MNLNDDVHRFETLVEPRADRRRAISYCPDLMKMPIAPSFDTLTYFLQTYSQQGITEGQSTVYRQLRVAAMDGADLTIREQHELEDAMENIPWTWNQDPSILYQFEAWWEKALHDQGWERVKVYH